MTSPGPAPTQAADLAAVTEAVDWDRSVLVLLQPDALARHLALPILDLLEDEGYVPSLYKPVHLGPQDVDRLYAAHIDFVWATYRYRAVDLMFRFGPSVAVVLRDERRRGVDAHGHLQDLKGKSDPARTGPGTIRGRLGAVNAVLNLLHSSSTPDEGHKEGRVVFQQEGGNDVLSGFPGAGLRPFLELSERSAPPERRGFDAVLEGVRARALSLHLGVPSLPDDLAAAAGFGFVPEDGSTSPDGALRTLGAHGVHVDAWERLVLVTSSYFAPRRS